ncbi:hypothetical protein AOC36_05525 [Erysipelothrix larvae]|uniref:Uncharacterized protein n=1 Tax=Erysipelothrix larvae TaxID=1514105 RepID=A0A0X8GZV4_9FIRM|nr:hypothetical protein [Erysipelothrix larvae]AMC93456.1 hypothetical protein AOC36_05525 [Erysipelothrix larvae]
MSKYDAYLTEVVYEIDDLIYDFYRQSNDLISKKKNQDRLIDFRDKTISTLNDMNVRSLEIISQFKDHAMVEDRVDVLVEKNRSILESALTVIDSDKSVGSSVKDVYQNVYEGARKVVDKVNTPETVDKIKDVAQDGYEKVKETIHTVSEDPRFIEGVQKTKDVAKDIVTIGGDALKVSSLKLKEWLDSRSDTSKQTPDVDDLFGDYPDFEEEVNDNEETEPEDRGENNEKSDDL